MAYPEEVADGLDKSVRLVAKKLGIPFEGVSVDDLIAGIVEENREIAVLLGKHIYTYNEWFDYILKRNTGQIEADAEQNKTLAMARNEARDELQQVLDKL